MAELKVFDDLDALSLAAVEEITKCAEEAIAARGEFKIALSGGDTPKPTYRLLGEKPWRDRIDWDRVDVFWGDDRHVPPTHPDSNFKMAMDTLLSKLPIPLTCVFRMRTENPDAEEVASDYEQTLFDDFDLEEGEWPRFDLVLMGIGADGHTASLFPGSEALRERERFVVAPWVSSLRKFRITLTPPVFNNARLALFLVNGEEKAEALKAVLEGDFQPDRFPAQIIRPEDGRLLWMVDRAAARELLPQVGEVG